MPELRWALLVVGIVVVITVYLYSRRHGARRRLEHLDDQTGEDRAEPIISGEELWGADEAEHGAMTHSRPETTRREPSLGSTEQAEHEHDARRQELPPQVEREPVIEPDAGPPIDPDKIVAMRVAARAGRTLSAEQVVLKLRELGLRHGKFSIFHKHRPDGQGPPMFSAASMTEPGSFDLSKVRETLLPGVTLFMVLPGPADPVESFDAMVDVARDLARDLDGEMLDESGSTWSIQRERYIREELIRYRLQHPRR